MNAADQYPLTSEGGVEPIPSAPADPFSLLDDLMQVVEALCPTYPPRDTFETASGFKL